MTKYYQSIFKRMEPLTYMHFQTDKKAFVEAVENKHFDVMSLNNRVFNFNKVPTHYKGSHFIRDPRDLCVSGMNYHRKTAEKWVHVEHGVNRYKDILAPAFEMGLDPVLPEPKTTFQNYLRSISDRDALIFEMCWRNSGKHFDAMENWNYNNSNILEFKYEEIFGNEMDCFRQMFNHYGLPTKLSKKGLDLVERFSFKKVSSGDAIHANKGVSGQWQEHFKKEHEALFAHMFPNLLKVTGYDTFS